MMAAHSAMHRGVSENDAIIMIPDWIFFHTTEKQRGIHQCLQPGMQAGEVRLCKPDCIDQRKLPDKGEYGDVGNGYMFTEQESRTCQVIVEVLKKFHTPVTRLRGLDVLIAVSIFILVQVLFEV